MHIGVVGERVVDLVADADVALVTRHAVSLFVHEHLRPGAVELSVTRHESRAGQEEKRSAVHLARLVGAENVAAKLDNVQVELSFCPAGDNPVALAAGQEVELGQAFGLPFALCLAVPVVAGGGYEVYEAPSADDARVVHESFLLCQFYLFAEVCHIAVSFQYAPDKGFEPLFAAFQIPDDFSCLGELTFREVQEVVSLAYLVECEAHLLHRDHLVAVLEVLVRVVAVSGEAVGQVRNEYSQVAPVTQCLHRYAGQRG